VRSKAKVVSFQTSDSFADVSGLLATSNNDTD